VKSFLFSKDCAFIAIVVLNEIIFMSIPNWEKVDELNRPSEKICCCWGPTSDRFLIGSSDGIVTILGMQNSTFKIIGELDGKDSPVIYLDWSHDGQYIMIGREDATVTVYNAADICENFFFTQTEVMSRVLDSPARFVQFTSDSDMFGEIHIHRNP